MVEKMGLSAILHGVVPLLVINIIANKL